MAIQFSTIPADWRLPLFFAEVNNSQANSAVQNQRALIIGQITSSGNATPNVPVICSGLNDAIAKGGPGSMLARMVGKYRENDATGELWVLPLSDAGGAVAAIGSFDFTAAATTAGVLSLYIGGRLVSLPVLTTQTTAQLATALVAAINAIPSMPVIATVDGSSTHKVDLTAKNAGAEGNDIDVRLNYRGVAGGEVTPPGLTYTIVQVGIGTAGATNPTLTTALANCLDKPFDFVVLPYTDTTSLDAIKAFLNDTTGRWSFNRQVYGHALTALRGTVGALTTAGLARNDQHTTIMGFNDSPNPNDEWAAAVFATGAVALRADPGRPLQTLAVQGLLPPPLQSRFQESDRNALLHSGISTFTVAPDGTIALENVITTYQLNASGQPDNSYLEIETLFQLMWNLRDLAVFVTSTYPRMKLAADGTRLAPGVAVVTPSVVRNGIIARYRTNEYNGMCQNSAAFAAGLVVQQNAGNPNRLDCFWPGVLMDQLRMFALLAQFRFQ